MKNRSRFVTFALFAALALIFASGIATPRPATADGCYICTSGSSDYCKNQCAYRGQDTQENRKRCREAGCKIGGTASCSSAANVKVCLSDVPGPRRSYASAFELIEGLPAR